MNKEKNWTTARFAQAATAWMGGGALIAITLAHFLSTATLTTEHYLIAAGVGALIGGIVRIAPQSFEILGAL